MIRQHTSLYDRRRNLNSFTEVVGFQHNRRFVLYIMGNLNTETLNILPPIPIVQRLNTTGMNDCFQQICL